MFIDITFGATHIFFSSKLKANYGLIAIVDELVIYMFISSMEF